MKLYTMDDCVYCTMLKLRLSCEGIQYEEIKDESVIAEKSFATVPQLEVDGQTLDFNQSIAWLNGRGES